VGVVLGNSTTHMHNAYPVPNRDSFAQEMEFGSLSGILRVNNCCIFIYIVTSIKTRCQLKAYCIHCLMVL